MSTSCLLHQRQPPNSWCSTLAVYIHYHVSLAMTIWPLSWVLIAFVLLSLISFDPESLAKGDADFIDVTTNLEKDHSGRKGDSKDKYFRKLSWLCWWKRILMTPCDQMSLRAPPWPAACRRYFANSNVEVSIPTTMAGMAMRASWNNCADTVIRFASKQVSKDDRLPNLTALIQTFLFTMADIGAETWIMHGTLLGWWWNQKVGVADAFVHRCR